LVAIKETKWKQRSAANWLKNGDKNTKYFHAFASTRRFVNFISKIVSRHQATDSAPITYTHAPKILKEFHNYYLEILGTKLLQRLTPSLHNHYPEPPSNRLDPYTTPYENLRQLIDPISLQELKQTVFSLPEDKAMGSYDIPIEFFQRYWDTTWNNLLHAMQAFYHNRLDLWRINKAATLIPKKNESSSVHDFRPINVLSVLPKIITKILATHLEPLLPDLIHPNQIAFVKGCQITQTFISAREMLSYLSKNKIPTIFFKIDFHKAFDTISWDFLLEVLRTRGFPALWISWIKDILISTTSHSRQRVE
jgi:Reverse transcriptase (RNA-dependent DNA polymerase)